MREKAPTEAPITMLTLTIDGKQVKTPVFINSAAWSQWFAQGLDLYRDKDRYIDPKYRDYGKFQPAGPYQGLIAFADGVNWNPGGDGTSGNYIYNDGAWHYIVPSAESQTLLDFLPNNQQQVRDLEQKVDGIASLIDFLPNSQQQLMELSQTVESISIILAFERSNEQRLRDLEQAFQDNQTLYWMEA